MVPRDQQSDNESDDDMDQRIEPERKKTDEYEGLDEETKAKMILEKVIQIINQLITLIIFNELL